MIDPDVMYDRIIALHRSDAARPNITPSMKVYAETVIKRAETAKVIAETDPDAAWEFFTSGELMGVAFNVSLFAGEKG